MSTSDTKTGFIYLAVTIACIFLGAVYELFSHGVFSYYMLYAFLIPLLGGMIPFFWLGYFHCRQPGKTSRRLYHFGIATLTVGCFFTGALEIYGTTNRLTILYWILGGILLFGGILTYLIEKNLRTP